VTSEAVRSNYLGQLSDVQQEKQRAQYRALWDTEQKIADF